MKIIEYQRDSEKLLNGAYPIFEVCAESEATFFIAELTAPEMKVYGSKDRHKRFPIAKIFLTQPEKDA
jgi:hypothetical protein